MFHFPCSVFRVPCSMFPVLPFWRSVHRRTVHWVKRSMLVYFSAAENCRIVNELFYFLLWKRMAETTGKVSYLPKCGACYVTTRSTCTRLDRISHQVRVLSWRSKLELIKFHSSSDRPIFYQIRARLKIPWQWGDVMPSTRDGDFTEKY